MSDKDHSRILIRPRWTRAEAIAAFGVRYVHRRSWRDPIFERLGAYATTEELLDGQRAFATESAAIQHVQATTRTESERELAQCDTYLNARSVRLRLAMARTWRVARRREPGILATSTILEQKRREHRSLLRNGVNVSLRRLPDTLRLPAVLPVGFPLHVVDTRGFPRTTLAIRVTPVLALQFVQPDGRPGLDLLVRYQVRDLDGLGYDHADATDAATSLSGAPAGVEVFLDNAAAERFAEGWAASVVTRLGRADVPLPPIERLRDSDPVFVPAVPEDAPAPPVADTGTAEAPTPHPATAVGDMRATDPGPVPVPSAMPLASPARVGDLVPSDAHFGAFDLDPPVEPSVSPDADPHPEADGEPRLDPGEVRAVAPPRRGFLSRLFGRGGKPRFADQGTPPPSDEAGYATDEAAEGQADLDHASRDDDASGRADASTTGVDAIAVAVPHPDTTALPGPPEPILYPSPAATADPAPEAAPVRSQVRPRLPLPAPVQVPDGIVLADMESAVVELAKSSRNQARAERETVVNDPRHPETSAFLSRGGLVLMTSSEPGTVSPATTMLDALLPGCGYEDVPPGPGGAEPISEGTDAAADGAVPVIGGKDMAADAATEATKSAEHPAVRSDSAGETPDQVLAA